MGMKKAGILAAAIALGILGSGIAEAQSKKSQPSSETKAAQSLAAKGRAALRAQRYEDAEQLLRSAQEASPSPDVQVDLGRALIGLKRYVEAHDVLSELAQGSKSPAEKRAAAAAKIQLKSLEKRLPTLKLSVAGAPAGSAHVSVDGKDVDASQEIPLDPGEHTVTGEAAGFYRVVKKVNATEGGRLNEELAFAPEEKVAKKEPEPQFAPTPPPEPKEKESPSRGSVVPALAAFGLGAAGVGVGIGFGLMASSEADKVKAQCNGNECPRSVESGLSSAKTKGTASTIGFIVGGAGVVGGIVLLIARPGKGSPSPERSDAFVTPWIGPGMAGARGAF